MKLKRWIKAGVPFMALLLASPGAQAADLSLQEAINMALAQNTGLKVTQKGEDTAKYALEEAQGNNGVTVGLSDSLSTSKTSGSDRQDSNSLSLSGKMPLYSGGKNQANIKKAKIGVESASLETQRAQEVLKLNVIKSYYDALEAKKTVGVRQETVDKYQEHFTNVSQLYAAGSKARIDVIRSQVELSNARQNLIKAENSYELELADLRNYLNIDRSEPLNLTTDFSYLAFDRDMGACIDYAYSNRKDLLVDKNKLAQQEQAIKAAKAGYLPSLNLSLGLNENQRFHPDSDNSHGASATLGMSWNIFDSGITRAQVKSAETNRDIAKLNYLKDKEQIDLDVRQAYYNMREAEKRFNSTQDAVHQAEEDAFIAREKYRAGEGLMLDIIDAQEALSTARLNYISAQYDYARYKATVENAMGVELTAEEKQAAALLETDADTALAQSRLGSSNDTTVDSTRKVAEELAGNEGNK
ncbi:TolC family protein [Selenomonas ruminantium]|uniref:Outer membrane protein TolC n=1 Tax=Selenomonas ruminantium TaxID=971 RepID=A0A1I0WZF4_SELRU|nr:TolC family protein [Selenomonas ruminantium]SFA94021.1 Outer membrane protein TolC [Selenomonas ruminantium]